MTAIGRTFWSLFVLAAVGVVVGICPARFPRPAVDLCPALPRA